MTQPNEYELFADAQKSGQHYTLDGMCACGLPTDDCHFSDELAECELSSVEGMAS